ncbi:PREDICTED: ACT domain-containing protein ACR1 [Tarenaya hassleriana]|uniref:ACT domain-containing protein ACR1 n=1 Tax=Tarenaya hassleriana TaxID=28532 RepID=UPI00053CA19F|nr:PREDICTED: ACT domain-containing protein ACR1 [Tarenaya hassleriana]XP_010559226.1 PREDICTED: ACT domain-containing protein ACR1 [Tarenaya hassleriana]
MMEMTYYHPHFDSELQSLIDRIHPPRVCIDNDSDPKCTLVKVDSVNKYGVLLDMVQVLADLDLVISKSYISSDGGWFMDVFHVTDQLGNKLTDRSLILYIQQAICASRTGGITKEMQSNLNREAQQRHVSTQHTAFEITGTDRPGLLSEISAALSDLGCHVTAAMAWTHHDRAAMVIYVEEGIGGGGINQLGLVKEQLENVVEAHHAEGETRTVKVVAPPGALAGWTHTERRLHQIMHGDRDYEKCRGCDRRGCGCGKVHVAGEACKEKGYSMVNVRCRDRPKLLFDTVCAFTELNYVVFHAAVGSNGPMADQEYFIRQKNGSTLDTESERQRLMQCLIAAIERRTSRGVELKVRTKDRMGVISDITRAVRENGLSITRAEFNTGGETTVGSIQVVDMTGQDADSKAVKSLIQQLGGSVMPAATKSLAGWTMKMASSSGVGNSEVNRQEKAKFSIGSLLWSQLERLSGNFTSIKS